MEERHTQIPADQMEGSLSQRTQAYVWRLFNQKNGARLVFHNYALASRAASLLKEINEGNSFPPEVLETSLIAAWIHYGGFALNYEQASQAALELADKLLKDPAVPNGVHEQVRSCLQAVVQPETAGTREAQLLLDGLSAAEFGAEFFEIEPLWRLELELAGHRQYEQVDWDQYLTQQLLNVRFLTPFGKETYEPLVARHLLRQKEVAEKSARRTRNQTAKEQLKYQRLGRRSPNSGVQTFFRTSYRNHINLSAIADNKANIMISVNAILISVLISILSYKNITETNPMVLMPVVIFLITGLSSLIFAVLSARPKVTSLLRAELPAEEKRKNIVFFGNFVQLPPEEYEEALDAMFGDTELLYGNMARDLYNLGKVLDKKYRYLTVSYNVFMMGFVATVVTFMIALFS
ncbi:MAG: hypothetical protein KDC41_18885 [Saprospiraceae bacterium]|nr:hypothetical protein [Saprospiraceae bacterium]